MTSMQTVGTDKCYGAIVWLSFAFKHLADLWSSHPLSYQWRGLLSCVIALKSKVTPLVVNDADTVTTWVPEKAVWTESPCSRTCWLILKRGKSSSKIAQSLRACHFCACYSSQIASARLVGQAAWRDRLTLESSLWTWLWILTFWFIHCVTGQVNFWASFSICKWRKYLIHGVTNECVARFWGCAWHSQWVANPRSPWIKK